MALPAQSYEKPPLKTVEEELDFLRRCRRNGLIPNPVALTGERREWAEEMQKMSSRMRELDHLIFGKPDPLPF